nr:YebO family protein [Serratia sp. DD3]
MSIVMGGVAALLGLWVWFLVNRASVRANEQIVLLQQIVEQQRQQTTLLKMQLQGNQGEDRHHDDDELNPALSYKDVIPER